MRSKYMRFPGGKPKAFTLSYDDNIEEDKQLIDLMEQYGIKGTFNLIPGWFAEEGTTYPEGETYRLVSTNMAKEWYSHPLVEVANHGFSHKYMTSLSVAEMTEEVLECRKVLESMYGRLVKGMAYPYGWYDDTLMEVLKMQGIDYCRTVRNTRGFGLPKNWLAWNPTCHHDDPKLEKLAERFVDMEVKEWPKLFYLWGHTFEFERNNNWHVIENFLQKIAGKEDIWYASNGEIYDYVKAYEKLMISADGKRIVNPAKFPVWVDIDGVCYEIKDELVLE